MKAPHLLFAVLVLAGLLGSIAIGYSQLTQPQATPMTRADHVVPPSGASANPVYLGNVVTNEGSSHQWRLAASLLRLASLPPSRVAHFNSVLSDPRLQLSGWAMEIRDVNTTNGVVVVKVRVTPLMVGHQSATVIGALDETYELGDHAVKFVQSEALSPAASVILD